MAVRRDREFRRFVMSVQYRGSSFLGFSYQKRQEEKGGIYSVEGSIRRALDRLVGNRNHENIQVSSRTDRGVHALHNTFHVDIRPRRRQTSDDHWNPERLVRGLNYYLTRPSSPHRNNTNHISHQPSSSSSYKTTNNDKDDTTLVEGWSSGDRSCIPKYHNDKVMGVPFRPTTSNDIRILSCAIAPLTAPNKFFALEEDGSNGNQPERIDWNARFTATSRSYLYRILNIPGRYDYAIPFEHDRSWRISDQDMNVHAMKEAANSFLGTLDFTSFRGKGCQRLSPIISMNHVHVHSTPYRLFGDEETNNSSLCGGGNLISIAIKANGFLYRQVRNMVGCLVSVGKEKMMPHHVKDILHAKDRAVAPSMAPPHGLFLSQVEHGTFKF